MAFWDGFWIALIAMVVVRLPILLRQAQVAQKAKAAYDEGLSSLKRDPGNADLRQEILKLGRAYSNLTRNKRWVTPFSEAAVLNDINAVCGSLGGPVAVAAAAPVDALPTVSIEERLAKLDSLKRNGLISEAEYDRKRAKLLDEV